jgi:signal transduction histidine kinase
MPFFCEMKQPESSGRRKPEQTPNGSDSAGLDIVRDVARSLLSHPNTLRDLDPIAHAARATGGRVALLLVRGARETLTVEAASGLDAIEGRGALLESARRLAGWSIVSREAVLVADYAADPRFEADALVSGSFASVPLLLFGEAIGALVVFGREEADRPSVFGPHDVELFSVLADQAALALHNIRLSEKAARLEKKARSLEAEVVKKEALATLGEMTGALIAEIRQPVAAIAGFARRVVRSLPQGDLNREYLDVIISETERLDRLVTEQLEMAPILKSQFRMEDLNSVVEATLRALRDQIVARKVRCLNRLATGLPLLLLDAEKVELMVRNIMQDLLASVPPGGRLKVESKRAGETVVLLVAADGPRTPGDVLERLFVPFRGQSSGPALAVTHQIVKEHGGEIGVRSDPEWPTVFTVSFPIKANADRRRATERRKTPRDRRSRGSGRNAA